MRVTIIAAMGQNRTIGNDDGLPWHLPRDLKRFRTLTMGKPVIVGRKTMEHIGHPLPGRPNVVLTRRPVYATDGVRVAHSIAEALEAARQEAERLGVSEIMVIGGGEVYRQFLPVADRVYLTVVNGDFPGTATFPYSELNRLDLQISDMTTFPADDRNPHADTFIQLDRTDSKECRKLPSLTHVA